MARAQAWARFRRNRGGLVGLALVILVAIGAIAGPHLDAHSPLGKNIATGLSPLGAPRPPSAEFPLGTDTMGRCVAARLLGGAQISLEVGVLATIVSLAIGLVIGLIAGYAGGPCSTACSCASSIWCWRSRSCCS